MFFFHMSLNYLLTTLMPLHKSYTKCTQFFPLFPDDLPYIPGTASGYTSFANVPHKGVVCRRETYAPDVFLTEQNSTVVLWLSSAIGSPKINQTKMSLAFEDIISKSSQTEVAIVLLFKLIFF